MDNREIWLAMTMVGLADTGDADFDEAAYSGGLAARLAELLGPAEVGVLIADDGGQLTVVAASSERAGGLASFEARRAEGPCTRCYRTGRPVFNEGLVAAGTQWPRFAAAARRAGFGLVSALPMRRQDETIGAVIVLSADGQRLAAAEGSLAQILAEVAAVGILQQRALRRSVQTSQQLQHALGSRVVIEQAKGAVAARLAITPSGAFELLRGYARQHNRLLAEVAGETIRGELPVRALVAAREASHRRGHSPARR
jgi:GAF domain-containing protein